MNSVFLDSSVLVAAAASLEGASALILGWCREGKIAGYVSADVLGEAKKNVALKLPSSAIARLDGLVEKSQLALAPDPTPERVKVCEQIIHAKDAPILAAALQCPADMIVTFDKRHFFTKEVVAFVAPKIIMIPGDYVKKVMRGRHT
ncbi:PIN domain-containing protein [Candidatus Gottesmanbacteria bacterium]|nr:PIN domain-containing protein [Candidatus Gottesmanbacteria bacterium]